MKKLETNNIIERIFQQRNSLFYIMGPCVIESEDIVLKIAEKLYKISSTYKIDIIFKASYSKANRSSIDSYTGPGIVNGLKILQKIKAEFGFPILTDVHTSAESEIAGRTADIIQIPAFLCRQTDLILSAAKTGKIVNIKKGQFASAAEMRLATEKAVSAGTGKVILTERGTTFGYNNLVEFYGDETIRVSCCLRCYAFSAATGFRRQRFGRTTGICSCYGMRRYGNGKY